MTASPDPLKPKRNLKPLRQLAPYLVPYKTLMIGASVALLTAGLTTLGIVRGLRCVIDYGFAANNPAMLDKTLLGLLAAILVLAAATYTRYSCVARLGERVIGDLRRAMYRHFLSLSPAYYEVTRSGDILSRLSADTAVLQTLIGSSISVALRNCVLLAGGIIMMLATSAKLTGFVLLGIPFVVVPIIILGRKVRRLSKANQERAADVSSCAEETIYGIRTVQAFNHEGISAQQFNATVEDAVGAAVRHISVRAIMIAVVISVVMSAIGVVLWIGGHDVLNHILTAGQLTAFVSYAAITASAMGAISEVMGDLSRAAGATDRIFELLSVTPTITAPSVPAELPTPRGELGFEQVTFAYPSRPDVPALKNISFTVKAGERVAIVGPSGGGKTTLYQMILRFYDPQMGIIRLDGVDVKNADPSAVRARLGLVPQDPVIFSTTAWENIGYGRPDASQEAIRDAARMAHADEFLSLLPDGYGTHLGEKGVRLSGGQKQRVAIARAILRNPSLLLLDEATSALDAESERLVQDALDHLMKDRTTLIIAHRLSTVMNADRIMVMDQGQIVAMGTHQSLIAEGGLYARLASLQFDRG